MGCWLNFGLRLVLAPAFVAKAVLQIPFSYTREEPSRSDAWGAGASLAAASGSSQATNGKAHAASAAGLPGTSQPLTATLIGKPEFQLVLRRIVDMWNSLLLLLYTAVPYNLLVFIVKLLGAGVFLTWLEPRIQRFLSIFIGRYQLQRPGPNGERKVLYSFANSVDTNFTLPRAYADFPFTTGDHHHGQPKNGRKARVVAGAKRAHLCGMASKLAYEDPLTIADAVTLWGFKFLTDQKAGHTSSTVPETYWFAFYNDHAVIICFRGTSPLNLINWQTDIDLGMSSHPGYGRVHDGFYEALFGKAQPKESLRDGFSTLPNTVFSAALKALNEEHVADKRIYICGHSLGGALSSVFAMALTVQNPGMPPPDPGMAQRIAGVLTYGQPRVGDDDYASIFDDMFGCKKALRHVHASDIVAQVPVGLGYVHHDTMHFIPSFDVSDLGRVLTNNDLASKWEFRETRLEVALRNSIGKLLWSQWPPRESLLHTLTRILLLPLPGLLDHFPGDYEALLREDVRRKVSVPASALTE